MIFSKNKIVKLPEKFSADFSKIQTRLIKSRLKLAAFLLVLCNFLGDGIGIIALQEKVVYQMKLTWTISIIICIATYLVVPFIRSFKAANASAFAFTSLVLFMMTKDGIGYATAPFDAAMGFIFLFFAFSLVFPWSANNIIAIALLHFGAYTALLLEVPQYVYKGQILNTETADYLNGFIMLILSAVVCYAVIRRERNRDIENFILLKDVEEKNSQMEKELKLATRVHSRLIPHSNSTPFADIAVTYTPMHYLGGDYAKFYFIDKTKLVFIICDVTGHGVSAALMVNALNTEFERLSRKVKTPGEILKEVNQFMVKNFSELYIYTTAFCGLLDFHYLSRKFSYSSYGHPPQYIYHSARPDIERLPAQASLMGLPFEDAKLHESEVPFNKNDSILLFTDGIIEARDKKGEEFGDKRLMDFIEKNRHLGVDVFNDNLSSELKLFSGNKIKDDIFILNIKTK